MNVTANGTDVVHALTLAGVNPESLAGTTGALSASGQARGNLDALSFSNVTMDVRALEGRVRGQPISLAQPTRLGFDGSRLAIEPMHVRLGGLSIRAAGSWETVQDAPADGIVVGVDGRFEDALAFFPVAAQDGWSAEGSLEAELRLRGGRGITSISGDVLAQLTSREEQAPERAGPRARRERNLAGEMRVRVDLGATAFDPNAVDGTIVATTGVISAGQLSIAQQAPTSLRLAKGRIQIEAFDWKLPAGTLTASGTVGLGPRNDSDVRVAGATSLALVDAFLPGRGDGRAAFDIRVAGPSDRLRYEGTIELDDASLVLPEGRFSVAGWSGRLDGQRRRRRVRASRPGQRRRRFAQRDGDPARQRAGASADHHREERVPGDSSRAQERARCRSDMEQPERACASVGHGDDLGRRVSGARQQPWCARCRR